jgi:hypothetical protein
MHTFSYMKLANTLIFLLVVLSACSIVGGNPIEATATPVPTSSIPGLQVVASQMCQVASQGILRVEQLQGDLVAWSPVANTLAYIAPTNESTWNVGELNLLSAPLFDTPQKLVTQAAGDLNWSPAGITIAYLSLRRSDNLYSIGLVNPGGSNTRDLFPDAAARTDSNSSLKAILDWVNEGRVRVLTSCGLNCMQQIDFGILTGLSTAVGDPIQRSWDLWSVTNNQPAVIPTSLTNLSGQLNWSPDGNSIAYIDGNESLSIINAEAGTLSPIEIGTYSSAAETDWSFDSQYLAVRADQHLIIYSFRCP